MKRLAFALIAGALTLLLAPSASGQAEHIVEIVELEGVIDPTSADYLLEQLDDAERAGADAIVIQLDTPGGLAIAMEDMVQAILESPVPVVVWIGPPGAQAASAGVFLVYASHVAAMAEGTSLGAAHPVDLSGELSDVEEEKAVNAFVSRLVSLAEQRGRDTEFAESTIRESEAITEREARERGVAEVLANTLPELLGAIDGMTVETAAGTRTLVTEGDDVTIRFHEAGLIDRVLHAVTSPTVAYLLLVLGFWAIVFEISQPGVGFAGMAGLVSLILAFYAFSVLPLNLAGLILVILGLVLFTVDVFTAGLGVFTVGGALSLTFGSILLFRGFDPAIDLPIWVVVLVVAGSVLFFGFAMTVALRARRGPAVMGQEGLIGLEGESRVDLSPEGQVWVKGALWRARALNGPIPSGRRVRVRRVDGLLLIVQEVQEEGGPR